jgi:hypothetical protein
MTRAPLTMRHLVNCPTPAFAGVTLHPPSAFGAPAVMRRTLIGATLTLMILAAISGQTRADEVLPPQGPDANPTVAGSIDNQPPEAVPFDLKGPGGDRADGISPIDPTNYPTAPIGQTPTPLPPPPPPTYPPDYWEWLYEEYLMYMLLMGPYGGPLIY